MERTMTVEEKIRRAEDIYNRRNGVYAKSTPKEKKSRKGTTKKLLMQIFICLSIYTIFYAVTNREYVFSKEFRSQVSSFFTEKTKVPQIYSNIKSYISSKFDANNNNLEQTNTEENAEKTEEKNEEQNQTKNVENTEEKKDENIGGAKEENNEDEKKEENLSEQQLMEKEAKEIKEKINFITPINGRISSTFGWRNPTTATVPKYHTGLDIAAKEGTVIKSATEGKVIMASSKGDYGNHYQIEVKDVVLVYAHCKKLYLKEGDIVKQGQDIGEVGSTGNSTGPHLHFEIRKGDKKIDPQLILDI